MSMVSLQEAVSESDFGGKAVQLGAALRARLDAAAQVVEPGGHVPFIVLFVDYPENLADLRLEVKLEPQEEGSAGDAQP